MYYKLFRTKTELFKKYKHLVNMTIELSLASILANVVTNFRNTELNYISDFNLPGIYVGVFSTFPQYLLTFSPKQNKETC